jgi:hypothetical protein
MLVLVLRFELGVAEMIIEELAVILSERAE